MPQRTRQLIATAILSLAVLHVSAQEAPASHGLTGNWAGARSGLADRGITLNLEYTGIVQGVVAGTEAGSEGYGGKADIFLDLDAAKLGLWDNGGLRTHVEYRHGEAGSNLANTLFATNTAALWPIDEPEELVATSLYYTHRLGESGSLLAGKFNPMDLLATDPFFGGWGTRRFMNLIFAAPPSGLVPPVFMGAVVNARIGPANWTVMIFDPDDRTTDYFPGDLFENGVNGSITASYAAPAVGRKATYSLIANFSTAEGVDYTTLPPGIETTNRKGAWNVAFQYTRNLQQQSDGSLGFYFKAAIADGNPNYVKSSAIAGIGGRPLFLSRPQDQFGLGMFYYDLSDELQDTLDPRVQFGDESGIEAYYSWAATPWLNLTGDVQFIDPARRGSDKSLVVAVRANIRF